MKEQVRALCDAKRRGFARHIGVSNFSVAQLDEAVSHAGEPLVTNQIEHHPWIDQGMLFKACARHGIAVTSYSPIGKARRLGDPVIADIARAKQRTPAQIVLRWQIQQPMNIAIPRSSRIERIAENFAIFDFALSDDEMRRVSRLGRS